MKKALIIVSIFAAILAIAVVGLQNQIVKSSKDTVYNLCQESRTSNKISEQTCGELQDYYNVEYLCKERNALTSNKCWTEVK